MRPAIPAVLLVLALLTGCGGDDGPSADDYRAQLNAACERLAEAQARLPELARDEGLTVDQLRERAERNGERFAEEVDALDPPEELRDAHDRLLARRDAPAPGGDADEVSAWLLRLADLYDELGADECERGQRASARALVDSQTD